MKEQNHSAVVSIETYTEHFDTQFDGVTFRALEKVCFHDCVFTNCQFEYLDNVLFVECTFNNCTLGPARKTAFVFCNINRTHVISFDLDCTFNLTNLTDVTGVRCAQYGKMLAIYQEGQLMFHRYDEESGDIESWQDNLTDFIELADEARMIRIERTREMLWKVSEIL